MPPTSSNLSHWLHSTIESAAVILFSKSYCPYCHRVKDILKDNGIKHATIELDRRRDGSEIQNLLKQKTGLATVPQIFVRGTFIGDSSAIAKLNDEGIVKDVFQRNKYDYDLVVIGGGSGGLAASKEAARLGAKTAVLDFVTPTPHGTTWGLGGTCVNVGCIPKKLMHQAALLGHGIEHASHFGWKVGDATASHGWAKLVEAVGQHIRSLNWGYKVALRDQAVKYENAIGEIIDPHTIKLTKANGSTSQITTNTIILATGERPHYPGIEGDKYAITSDDLFSLPYSPGKTLVIGASYVALECAGFLTSLGYDTTVMVRSILLRGFDQQMAEMIGEYMKGHGTKFIRPCIPTKITEIRAPDKEKGVPGRYRVDGSLTKTKENFSEEFDTVIFAVGRDPCVDKAAMDKLGVKVDGKNRIVCGDNEQSSVENIYAVGDIVSGKPQLTPVAIHAGRYLARRLYGGGTELTDYVNVATTVFTPLEYGAIGFSEEAAIEKYGKDKIEVYHSHFNPLEWALLHRDDNVCYAKLVCLKSENEKVIGFHVLGPNAGEITQGYAVAIKLGATKADFDSTIGIHPTCSEVFTTLHVSKSSGATAKITGC